MKRRKFRYTVENLAEKLNLEPVSVRYRLRRANIPKVNGRFYGWDSFKDYQIVLKAISFVGGPYG